MLILSVFLFHHLNRSIKNLHLITQSDNENHTSPQLSAKFGRFALFNHHFLTHFWCLSAKSLMGYGHPILAAWHTTEMTLGSSRWAPCIRRLATLPLSGELRFTGNSHEWLGFPRLFDIALALTPRSPHQPFQPPLSARDGAKPGQLKQNLSIGSVVRNPFKNMGHCLKLSPY